MRAASRVAWACRLAVATVFLCTCAGRVAAQTTEPALKAAFLFSFVKFVAWPADALTPGEQVTMCVVGDAGVAVALRHTINGRTIDGHALTIAVLKVGESGVGCHLIYVSSSEVKRSAALLLLARDSSVLTVSDHHRFAASGGVVELIVESNHISLAINIASAKRGRLIISSKLLNLAKIVTGDRVLLSR